MQWLYTQALSPGLTSNTSAGIGGTFQPSPTSVALHAGYPATGHRHTGQCPARRHLGRPARLCFREGDQLRRARLRMHTSGRTRRRRATLPISDKIDVVFDMGVEVDVRGQQMQAFNETGLYW